MIVTLTNICLNIEIDVFLVDCVFFKTQTSKIFIKIMISSLKIRDLNTNRHEIWKYVICDIYLLNIKNDKKIMLFIQREIYLINNLKINILIKNDITSVEKFIIDMTKKHVIINNINVFIALNIRSFKIVIQRLIHLRKIIVIFLHAKMIIFVHNVILSINRDFLFELNDDINLSMYVYLVDVFTFFIVIRNEQNMSIQISRNYRLDRIFEFDFINIFHINDSNNNNVRYLIIKNFKSIYRIDWFKRFIFAYITIYVIIVVIEIFNIEIFTFVVQVSSLIIISSLDIELKLRKSFANIFNVKKFFANFFNSKKITFSNDVTIYNSFVTNSFAQIMKIFFAFWHEIDFVKMSKNKWIRIFFKTNWKFKIFDKIKIYSWKIKNRELIDKTFDEFHRINKLL